MAARYGAGTDVGLTREHNEDAYLVNDELGLWIVADGMGGHEAGEVASAIAVQTVNAAVARGESLERAMNLAHKAVLKGSRKGGPGVAGMGCTCVATRIVNNDFEVAWVGDSRAYQWNGARLVQLSHDHSYVQTLVDLGVINEQEAIDHPDRSVLTQCLGSRSVDELEVGTVMGHLNHGESLMLCSDGLTGEVDDPGIAEIMGDSSDEQVAVDRLIIAALEGGGSDNVTVIVVSSDESVSSMSNASVAGAGASARRQSVSTGASDSQESRNASAASERNSMPLAATLAAAAQRGGSASAGSRNAAVQMRTEEDRRRRMGQHKPARAPLVSAEDLQTLKQILFMRVSPVEMLAYGQRRMREWRRRLDGWLLPLVRQLSMLGVYFRRAVLALGVGVVSLGIAGGIVHSG